ncbi:MAG: ErfK/YbiS/YcfS/YnhG family protein [Thermoleophilia bacterium]|nr:ErfK/YbiS/YcfS/YnhG family protein [Thermoleophilia bacterium]
MLVLIGLLLVLVAGLATAIVLTMPRLSRVAPSRLTNDATPTLVLRMAHPAGIAAGDVEATVDGRVIDTDDVEVLRDGRRIELHASRLADGAHDTKVTVHGAGLLHRTLTQQWSFTVDTTPPPARIVAPRGIEAGTSAYVAAGVAVVTTAPMRLTVGAEVGTVLDVTSTGAGARALHVAKTGDTRRTVDVTLPEGTQVLTVAATDPAGNVTERTMRVLVDTKGPKLAVRVPRIVKDAQLALPITARDAQGVQLQVKLDGTVQEDAVSEVSVTDAPFVDELSSEDDVATDATDAATSGEDVPVSDEADPEAAATDEESAAVLPIGGRYTLTLDDGAYEGRHALEVVATDSLGAKTTFTRTFFVDSTEQLSEAAGLRTGATGNDVAQLHQVLLEQGIVSRAALANDLRTKTYGAQTRAAIGRYQGEQGMARDGVAGADTIAGLTLKIVIDRSANTLTLYRVGKVVKTYGVATGSPEFPTPTGDFEIQSMQENPTWTPPDSDWAKDAEVIPPGPDNPLGTRWMAIQGTVGIHGTNNPASIGYSVSHGCIRMAIPDVEDLYSRVAIGTRVTVV